MRGDTLRNTLSMKADSGVVAVLMERCSCAVPHTTQRSLGGSVHVGYTSLDELTCCSTIVFCNAAMP